MRTIDFEKKISWLLAIGGSLTSIIVLAWNANEPVNAPKLLVLAMTAFAAFFYMVLNRKEILQTVSTKITYAALVIFVLTSIVSVSFSDSAFISGFFGNWGRNTGLLTYLSLCLVLAAATQIRSKNAVERVLSGLFYAGVVNAIYFLLTLMGIELIPWSNVYKRVLGTFGNPNFVGAFMGMFVILCIIRALDGSRKRQDRLISFVFIPIAILEVKMSLASQGFAVIGLGIALIGFFYLLRNLKTRVPIYIYSIFSTLVGIFALAGALQKGPLAEYLYKSSVSFRGEYWAAGWRMGLEHPLLGVGLDSYGLWYRRMRSAASLVSPGKDVTTNTAHNVYLDIFASGGFPLLVAYLALMLVVLGKIIYALKSIKEFDATFVALTALWAGYQLQSLVSINQIGIAIWGWILSGLVIGYHFTSNGKAEAQVPEIKGSKTKGRLAPANKKKSSVIPIIVGGALGLAVASPPYMVDVKWRTILVQPNQVNLERGAKAWPITLERIVQASEIYTKNNVPLKGIELAKFGTEQFPTDFRAWYFYYKNPNISPEEKIIAKRFLTDLDPLNPDFN